VEVPNPLAAQKLGITLIHQEPISFPDLSVAENLVLGRAERPLLSRVPWGAMTRNAARLMDLLGVRIDVTRPMRGLSIADQQMVEIARALDSDSRLIIMDEPTAPLTPKEVETLFTIARGCATRGAPSSSSAIGWRKCARSATASPIFRDGAKVETAPIGRPDRPRDHPPDDRPSAAGIHAQARDARSATSR
jgi:rhamnose transport system ATP-binding protein